MSNVPPPIKFNKNVFIYFHNDLLINPLRTNLDIIDRGFNLMKKLYIKFLNNKSYKWIVQTKLMKKNLSNSFSINPNKIKIFPIPLSVLWLFAAMNSLSLRFFGIGHLSIGKLREFLYVDWSSEDIIKNPTPFTEALRITSSYYQKEKNV